MIGPRCRGAALLGVLALAAVPETAAAEGEPHVAYAYPAGGPRGTTFEVVLGGRALGDPERLLVSGEGVSAAVARVDLPPTAREALSLRETLGALEEKRRASGRLGEDETRTLRDVRARLAAFERQRANPSLGEAVAFSVTIAPDAPPGRRELRLDTARGLSNPLAFMVGDLPEARRDGWRGAPERRGRPSSATGDEIPTEVALPVTLNGQIPPAGVHRWRFPATRGRRVAVRVQTRALIPFVADAVPGWFQAVVSLHDATGREVAYEDDGRFRSDPAFLWTVPATGAYVIAVRDALYRGREDFVYRVTVGTVAGTDGDDPSSPALGAGARVVPLEAPGVLLEGGARSPLLPEDPFGREAAGDLDALPTVLEREPEGDGARAQAVSWPVSVTGRIEAPGDVDAFRFHGTSGERVVIEAWARRLGSPLDSMVVLEDDAGRRIAAADDHVDARFGLETHHADAYLSASLPASGAFVARLTDAQRAGGPAYAYRLQIRRPNPDFALRATPSTVSLRGGTAAVVTVHALRRDGFAGAIEVSLDGAPRGFALAGGTIPAGADQVRLTLAAPPSTGLEPFALRLEGRATVDGRTLVREVVPADDRTQAFALRHLVRAESLLVRVLPGFPAFGAATVRTPLPVRIPRGATARVHVVFPRGANAPAASFELSEPPAGVSLEPAPAAEGGAWLVLRADAATAKPGTSGNLVVLAFVERRRAAGATPRPRSRLAVGALPAIPFTVVEP